MLSRRLAHLVDIGLLSKNAVPRGTQGRYSLTENGVQLVPLLFELARVGRLLDPTTFTTEPRFEGWADHPEEVQAYMDQLRRIHLA